jgi:ribonuclease P protein component
MTVRTASATAHVWVQPGTGARFGYITGKRIGNAVTRNYAKRRFRDLTVPLLSYVPDGLAVSVIWRLNPVSVTASTASIERDIAKVWRKAVQG